MDMNDNMIIQQNENNQNTPIIANNNEQNQDLNSPLLPNQTNTMNQINYDINLINDNHINNYGYFYINDNPFFELMNQEKIIIKIVRNQAKIVISLIILFILFVLGIFIAIISRGTLSFIPIIAIIGVFIIPFCTILPCCQNYIWYNNENSNIEVNFNKKLLYL